jgi:hypothetical protein
MTHLKDIETLAEMVWKASALAEDLMNSNSRMLAPFENAEMDLNQIYNDLMDFKSELLNEYGTYEVTA